MNEKDVSILNEWYDNDINEDNMKNDMFGIAAYGVLDKKEKCYDTKKFCLLKYLKWKKRYRIVIIHHRDLLCVYKYV